MMKNIGFVFLFGMVIFVLACNGGNTGSNSTERINDVNGFAAFYKKFHQDSLYQIEHIRFPLEGVPSVTDTTYDGSSTYFWTKENWNMHRPIDLKSGEFKREFDLSEVLVEERIKNMQNFMLVRRFYFNGRDWSLIYYADLNPIR